MCIIISSYINFYSVVKDQLFHIRKYYFDHHHHTHVSYNINNITTMKNDIVDDSNNDESYDKYDELSIIMLTEN